MKTFSQFLSEGSTTQYGVYSFRPLSPSCATALHEWMIENQIPNPVPVPELHCSVITSTTHIPSLLPEQTEVLLKPYSYKLEMMERALTVSFRSSTLQERWNRVFNESGTPKYRSFRPHITLSYAVPLDYADIIEELKPPPFPIILGPEQVEPLIEDHDERVRLVEAAIAAHPVNVYVPPGSLNVPRNAMPQIKSDLVSHFLIYLRDHGIRVTTEKVTVSVLHPTQKEINLEKVESMMLVAPERALSKPVITSDDNYILDGHHRWLALLNRDPHFRIDTYRVHCKIHDLLKYANGFPGTTYKTMTEDAKDINIVK
jgi:hypothetical protein